MTKSNRGKKLLVRIAIVGLEAALALAPIDARADMPPAPSCEGSSDIPLAGALLTARREGDGLAWRAKYIVDVDASFAFRGGVLRFAVPLPSGESVRSAAGVAPLFDESGARVVGLCVSPEAIDDRTIAVSFSERSAQRGELGAPVAAGGAVQIVTSDRDDGARLEVAATAPLEQHVGYVAPRVIGRAAREEARRLTDMKPHITDAAVYVRGDDVRQAGGLHGHLVDPRARTKGSAFGVAVLFMGIVAALIVAARRLRDAASVERADAVLASEIEAATSSTHAPAAAPAQRSR